MGSVDDDRTFKLNLTGDSLVKLRHAVAEKLKEFMGDYTDDTLVEYVIVLLKNGRRKDEAKNELDVFLGDDDSHSFVSWLWDHLASKTDLHVEDLMQRKSASGDEPGKNDSRRLSSATDKVWSERSSRSRRNREWGGVAREADEPTPVLSSEIGDVRVGTKVRSKIFNMFRQNLGGQDIKVPLEISFMEAVQGCSKTVTFQAAVACEACGGSGVPPGTRPESCKRCKGSGMTFMQTGPFRMQTICTQCGGSGKRYTRLCNSCNGQRVKFGKKSVKLDVIPGVDDNETIRVYGSGGADPDGNQPGDLYVTIKVREDPVFRRDGADVHVDAVLNINQAILGGTIQVATLTGDVVLKIRSGTQPGQKVVLKKKGIKTRNSYTFGDQYVHFNVSIPTNLTQWLRELIKEFSNEEQGEYKREAAGAS